jgi:hypothetical protein
MGSSRRRTAVLAVLAAIGTMVAGAEPSGAAVAAPPLTGIEALGPVDLRAFDLDVSGREARFLAEPGTVQLLDDGVPVWTVPFEGDGRLDDVALLDDGGVIVTGTYDDQGGAQLGELGFPLGPHRRDAPHAGFTARLGPDGTPAWVATVRGVDASLVSATVVTDADGNSYVGGALDGDTARFDPDGVDLHVTGFGYVASYAPDGALRWVTHVEGPGGTALAAPALAATGDGGLVATSPFDDEVTWLSAGAPVVLPDPAGTRTLLVLRLATDDGAVEWTATAHSDRSVTGGAVDVDADGNAYVGGSFSRTTTMTVTGTSGSATVGERPTRRRATASSPASGRPARSTGPPASTAPARSGPATWPSTGARTGWWSPAGCAARPPSAPTATAA